MFIGSFPVDRSKRSWAMHLHLVPEGLQVRWNNRAGRWNFLAFSSNPRHLQRKLTLETPREVVAFLPNPPSSTDGVEKPAWLVAPEPPDSGRQFWDSQSSLWTHSTVQSFLVGSPFWHLRSTQQHLYKNKKAASWRHEQLLHKPSLQLTWSSYWIWGTSTLLWRSGLEMRSASFYLNKVEEKCCLNNHYWGFEKDRKTDDDWRFLSLTHPLA